MSDTTKAMKVYIDGLRNQHAVETQAIGTLQNELPRMTSYPDLHAKMQQDKDRSVEQAARLDNLLARHETSKSVLKEAAAGAVATVAGFAHAPASDELLKNVLSAIGYKAYEIASYKALATLAEAAGAAEDVTILETSLREEQEIGDWLGTQLPSFVHAHLAHAA